MLLILQVIGVLSVSQLFTEVESYCIDYSNEMVKHIYLIDDKETYIELSPANAWEFLTGEDFIATASLYGSDAPIEFRVEVLDTSLAELDNTTGYHAEEGVNTSITLRGLFLGRTYLNISIKDPKSNSWLSQSLPVEIVVRRNDGLLDTIFVVGIILLVVIINIGMGCKIKVATIKEVLKKPVAPIIGFVAQFTIMPCVSYAIGYLIDIPNILAFGLFGVGCSPGGSSSNTYSVLFNGDVSLSVVMTLFSNFAAFAMIPLWMYVLGGRILAEDNCNITIPYFNIFTSLFGVVFAVSIGMLIRRFKSNVADKIGKSLKVMSVLFIMFVFTFGSYVNLYMFKLFTPKLILAGALLPYFGILLGGVFAFIGRQDSIRLRTIALETGLQNTGIAILLMRLTLPKPESDIASVTAIVCAIFTPIPLMIGYVIYEIYIRRMKKKEKENDKDELKDETVISTISLDTLK